jgi:hypothetical protein
MNDLIGGVFNKINARIRRREALKTARAKRSRAWVPKNAKRQSGIVRKMVTPDSTAQPEYAEGKRRNLKRGGSSICPRKVDGNRKAR